MSYGPGFSRRSTSERDLQPVAVIAVDPTTRTASALTKTGHAIRINCAHATGDTITIPAVGEQWYCERIEHEWRLYSRIPFNNATLNIRPEEGQVSVGSATGPLELNGNEVRVNASVFRLNGVYYRDNGNTLERSTDQSSWRAVTVSEADGLVETVSRALAGYAGNGGQDAVTALQDWGQLVGTVVGNFSQFWQAACDNDFLAGIRRMGTGDTESERMFTGLQTFLDYLSGILFAGFDGSLTPQTLLANSRDLLRPLLTNKFVRGLIDLGDNKFLFGKLITGFIEFVHVVNDLLSCSDSLAPATLAKVEELIDSIAPGLTAMTPATVLRDLYNLIWTGETFADNPFLSGLVDFYRLLTGNQGAVGRNFLRDALDAAGKAFDVVDQVLSCEGLEGIDVGLLTGQAGTHLLTIGGEPTSGTFNLTVDPPGQAGPVTATGIAHDATAAEVQSALEAVLEGPVRVTELAGDGGRLLRVALAGALGASGSLTGGTVSAAAEGPAAWADSLPGRILAPLAEVVKSFADNPVVASLLAAYDAINPGGTLPILARPLSALSSIARALYDLLFCVEYPGEGATTAPNPDIATIIGLAGDSLLKTAFSALDDLLGLLSGNALVQALDAVLAALVPPGGTDPNAGKSLLVRVVEGVEEVFKRVLRLVTTLVPLEPFWKSLLPLGDDFWDEVSGTGSTPAWLLPRTGEDIIRTLVGLLNWIGLTDIELPPEGEELATTLFDVLAEVLRTVVSTLSEAVGGLVEGLLNALQADTLLDSLVGVLQAFGLLLEGSYGTLLEVLVGVLRKIISAPEGILGTLTNFLNSFTAGSALGVLVKLLQTFGLLPSGTYASFVEAGVPRILREVLKTMLGLVDADSVPLNLLNGILKSLRADTTLNALVGILSAFDLVTTTSLGTLLGVLKNLLAKMLGISGVTNAVNALNSILDALTQSNVITGTLVGILKALNLLNSTWSLPTTAVTPAQQVKEILVQVFKDALLINVSDGKWASDLVSAVTTTVATITDFWQTLASDWLAQTGQASAQAQAAVKNLFQGFNGVAVSSASSILGSITQSIIGTGYVNPGQLRTFLVGDQTIGFGSWDGTAGNSLLGQINNAVTGSATTKSLADVQRFFNNIRNSFFGNVLTIQEWAQQTTLTTTQLGKIGAQILANVLNNLDPLNATNITQLGVFANLTFVAGSWLYQLMQGFIESIGLIPWVGNIIQQGVNLWVAEIKKLMTNFAGGSRNYQQSGENLLADPKINQRSFWEQITIPGVTVASNVSRTEATGSNCLYINGNASTTFLDMSRNDLGWTMPIATAENKIYYVGCWVKGTGTATVRGGHVSLEAQSPQTNSSHRVSASGFTNIASLTTGTTSVTSPSNWTLIYGYFKVPVVLASNVTGTQTRNGFVPRVEATGSSSLHVDDLICREATQEYNANKALFNTPLVTDTSQVSTASVPGLQNTYSSLFGAGSTGPTSGSAKISTAALPDGLAGVVSEGSGIVLSRTTGSNTPNTRRGSNAIPAFDLTGSTRFYNSVQSSTDITVVSGAPKTQLRVSVEGWYLVEVSYALSIGVNAGLGGTVTGSNSWALSPTIYRIRAGQTTPWQGGNWADDTSIIPFKYGQSVTYYGGANTLGGTTVSGVQSSFIVYLLANESIVPGYHWSLNATGYTLVTAAGQPLISSGTTGGVDAGYGYATYCAMSLLNRSLN